MYENNIATTRFSAMQQEMEQGAYAQFDTLMALVSSHQQQAMPQDLSANIQVTPECWTFLQDQIAHNGLPYTMSLRERTIQTSKDKARSVPTMWLRVSFANTSNGEIYWSDGQLKDCYAVQQ
jgi:hypothetical protein